MKKKANREALSFTEVRDITSNTDVFGFLAFLKQLSITKFYHRVKAQKDSHFTV
jgi:hypothetical protein